MKRAIPGYQLGEAILADGDLLLYRGKKLPDGRAVLIKLPAAQYPHDRILKRLDHEFRMGSLLDPSWALRPIDLLRLPDANALVLEHFPGVPLTALPLPLDTGEFLRIAVAVASSLAAVHRAGLVHRDLKPANIIFHRESGELRLTGFGLAIPHAVHAAPASQAVLLEGTPEYLAPEQTGQLNRGIDGLTDLYAAGTVFYQLLTGELPCRPSDLLELVHCLVAVRPVPPERHRGDLAPMLSAIVMKLLNKLPEERYQTAEGLRADLAHCLESWLQSGEIPSFAIGKRDVCSRFTIPQQLYGREGEVAELVKSYGRVCESGTPELLLVSGFAGVGKSALVAELQAPVLRQRSFFVTGKFEQYLAGKPYATFAQALRGVVQRILMESDEQVARWRDAMVEAVGVNGRLMTELVPEIELLIGEQPPVPDLPLTQAENRFHQVFRRVLQLFCRQERPLVLFLDDLQWADAATLKLLVDLLESRDTKSLLVIVAYRDNEVSPSHPACLTLEEIRQAGVPLREIVLEPLREQDVNRLLADTIHADPADTAPLSGLIYQKSGGNPFFLIQFLATLYHDGLLTCDPEQSLWQWDLEEIRKRQYTENVVAFLLEKLNSLDPQVKRALHLAACIGATVELQLLAVVARSSPDEVEGLLSEIVKEGLLVAQDDAYRFVHDRVQQAAYAVGSEESRATAHIATARVLAGGSPAEAAANIFEIVGHFNRGRRLIDEREEKVRVAELNLVAGRRAQASAAYRSSVEYLSAGLEILGGGCWDSHAGLCSALTFEKGKSSWLAGDLDGAVLLLDEGLRHATSSGEKARILLVKGQVAMTAGDPPGAAVIILEALRLLNITWPSHPSAEEVQREYQEVWSLLGEQEIASIVDLPALNDPAAADLMEVLSELYLPAYWIDVNLQTLVTCRMVNLSLRHGNSDASAMGYAALGRLLGPKFGRYRDGYEFGKAAYELVERRKLLGYKARISDLFGISTSFWVAPLRQGLGYARISFKAATEAGDRPYACYACMHIVTYRLAVGDPLDEVLAESEALLDYVRTARYDEIADTIMALQRLALTVRGGGGAATRSTEEGFERQVVTRRSALVVDWYYIAKLQGCFFMGEYGGAVEVLSALETIVPDFMTQLNYTQYVYYGALVRARHYAAVIPSVQRQYLSDIRASLEKLELWAEQGAATFAPKKALVAAELARLQGEPERAAQLYDAALLGAREQGFLHEEGIAQEFAGRLFLSLGEEQKGRDYLFAAKYTFARWGAAGKVARLCAEFPELLPEQKKLPEVSPGELDLLAIVKASQAISQETDFAKVIERLLKVVMEHSGADRGVLLFFPGGERKAVAEATTVQGGIRVEQWPSGNRTAEAPSSVLNYVRRARKTVLLEDAREPSPFSSDPYFLSRHPLSVGCLPIIRQQELVGVIYLENSLVVRAFSRGRSELLELLAAQSAITLQNAQLYDQLRAAKDELELRVEQRTAQVTQALHDLRQETEERIQAVEELRRKEQMLLQQSRMGAMGEMLLNISHHWRQPLNLLAIKVQQLGLTYRYGGFSEKLLNENIKDAMGVITNMSHTIDVFQQFLAPAREKTVFEVDEVIMRTVTLIEEHFMSQGIGIVTLCTGGVRIYGEPNEYGQVLMNLLNNAKDALLEHREAERLITVRSRVEKDTSLVTITDNAGGVAEEIQEKIFDAYFTTKEQGKGTGVGLFLSRMIIEKNMGGRLSFRNVEGGAEFRIEVAGAHEVTEAETAEEK